MAFRRRDGFWLALMAVVVVWGGHLFNYVDAARTTSTAPWPRRRTTDSR